MPQALCVAFRTYIFLCNNKELHTNYFLASLMSQASSDAAVLVAEVDRRAVGIMSLTTRVDVKSLRKSFFLDPFNYLQGMVMIYSEDNYSISPCSYTRRKW